MAGRQLNLVLENSNTYQAGLKYTNWSTMIGLTIAGHTHEARLVHPCVSPYPQKNADCSCLIASGKASPLPAPLHGVAAPLRAVQSPRIARNKNFAAGFTAVGPSPLFDIQERHLCKRGMK